MKIVLAPDSFKGTLSAQDACAVLARGVRAVLSEAQISEVPLADGGEGTVQTILAASGGEARQATVAGPLGDPVTATFGLIDDGHCAVIEMAAASGITLIPARCRDVLRATTFGTGELIAAALDARPGRMLIGIGGSATCDGGCGMAQALGVRFFANDEAPLSFPIGGGMLSTISRVDMQALDPRIRKVQIDVLCDVSNPLTGPEGAAVVYGPQKGASPDDVRVLDQGLVHLSAILERDVQASVRELPGAGAAGGLGGGLVAFLGARLRPGAQAVIDAVNLAERCRGADLIITGEGSFDAQSLCGKAVSAVAATGAACGVPVAIVAGRIALPRETWTRHFTDAIASGDPGPDPAGALAHAAAELVRRHFRSQS